MSDGADVTKPPTDLETVRQAIGSLALYRQALGKYLFTHKRDIAARRTAHDAALAAGRTALGRCGPLAPILNRVGMTGAGNWLLELTALLTPCDGFAPQPIVADLQRFQNKLVDVAALLAVAPPTTAATNPQQQPTPVNSGRPFGDLEANEEALLEDYRALRQHGRRVPRGTIPMLAEKHDIELKRAKDIIDNDRHPKKGKRKNGPS